MATLEEPMHEESLWFGSNDRPLFGRLTTPADGTSKGGVLISPPIGRESRLARRALRSLALYLAADGYVSLRFDHYGTGDSSGSMDDVEFDRTWTEGVEQGVALLRSLGVSSVSAVGMRMGATIVGTAASVHDLGLASLAMWDPCESGRAYARELTALGALRHDTINADLRASTKMLEYPVSDDAASRLHRFSLSEPTSHPLADRVLVIVRDDRTVSSKFRARWQTEHVDWTTTSEQGPLLETELPDSVQPASTIAQVRTWLTEPESVPSPISTSPRARYAIVATGANDVPVQETVVELGHRSMFGIVSEPVGDVQGPLLVMVNGINEDHVGPSRLWVELSRRWAGLGLRCVRFDFSESGESSWFPGQPVRPVFERALRQRQDVEEVVRDLNSATPDDSVLVGLCSGAQLALEATLELQLRGLCAINPQVTAGVLRGADRLRNSDRETVRWLAQRVEKLLKRHLWLDATIQRISRLVLLSAFSPKVRSTLAKNHSEMLVLVSPQDPSPFARIPIIGSLVGHRLDSMEHIHVEIVPGLDHDFLSTLGRARAVDMLNRHVVQTFVRAAR